MLEPVDANSFSIDLDRSGAVIVVRCHGRLVAGARDVLHSGVGPLIPECQRIVLDLTDLTYLDSMGLGAIVRLYVSARSAGGSLELVNIGPRIRQLLRITHLFSVFTVVGENDIRMP
jgi:anti-sigma B factor antagonist